MEKLLNAVGDRLLPRIICVVTICSRGAAVPDGGLVVGGHGIEEAGREAMIAQTPEGDVMEVKGPRRDALRIPRT